MQTIAPFDWRRLTPEGEIVYRLDARGALVFRGDAPPIDSVRVRDGRGGFVTRALSDLPFAWERADDGDGWALRTRGQPTTAARVRAFWGTLVTHAANAAGIDARLVFATIAAEAGGIAPDGNGLVRAPRTERGYPARTGESDPGDFARDAEDWSAYLQNPRGRIAHSSHGLMQTLISTAYAARPNLFAGLDPAFYRTVLWNPEDSIACGVAHMASFDDATLNDPIAFRFRYGGGHIKPTRANPWGATPLYDEVVPLFFVAYWNDDACLLRGACKAPSMTPPRAASSLSPAWLFAGASFVAAGIAAAYAAATMIDREGAVRS